MWLRMCVCEWRCCVSVCDLPWLQVSGLVRNDRLTLPSTPYPPGQTTELTHLLWRPARSFYPFSACTRFLCRVCVRALVCVVDFCQSKTSSMWRENSCHAFVLPYCEFCSCYKLVYAHSCVFHCEMESSAIDSFHWIKFVCSRCTLRALGFLFTGKKKAAERSYGIQQEWVPILIHLLLSNRARNEYRGHFQCLLIPCEYRCSLAFHQLSLEFFLKTRRGLEREREKVLSFSRRP